MKMIYIRPLVYLGLSVGFMAAMAESKAPIIEHIEVAAHPLSGERLLQSVDVLAGDELEQKVASNIGDTLARQPGIHSAAFGNAVGRPVIHGLSGPRIRIMEDRIDTLDVSVTSGDHAVGVEPFIAERIEVLKGAGSLLYGSGAIGGVVDVHTARIPHQMPENINGGIETRFNSNNDGSTTALKLNGGSGSFAWHLDGALKDANDYEIPGFSESSSLRALEEESSDDIEHEEEVRGYLPGSGFDSRSVAAGGSYIAGWGFAGFAVSNLSASYGLPGGHSHSEHEETSDESSTEIPYLELEQTRLDFELGVDGPFDGFDSLNIRAGHNDYQHREIEGNGEQATKFSNKAWEMRAELVQDAENWRSVYGLQYTSRAFSVIGEEAFIPPVDTAESGLFWVAEKAFDRIDVELGLRAGRVTHDPQHREAESFNTYAASLGIVLPVFDDWKLGLNVDYASRAPASEELFSNGPHLVTGTFEQGNAALDNESAVNLSTTLQYDGELYSASATGYYMRFTDFIYQQATSTFTDELPVVAYQQQDATFSGIDLELSVQLSSWADGEVRGRVMVDYVTAELDDSDTKNLPRLSPTRYGVGLDVQWGKLRGAIDYLRVQRQDHVAAFELETDAYNDFSIYANYELLSSVNGSLRVFLQGKNLINEEQRLHTSFIKDFAPAPGRTIETGIRLSF